MKYLLVGLVFTIGGFFGYGQKHFSISGSVYDADTKDLLPNVIVKLSQNISRTNAGGYFVINNLAPGSYTVQFEKLNYEIQIASFGLADRDINVNIYLDKAATKIDEVKISQLSKDRLARESSAVTYEVTKDYLDQNRENTLMQSLQNLPGIQAMGIGVGQSKPMIRGLGFNRIVVSQNGIKHEAQQWGSDHGLEIDQHDAGSIQIVKGPASLLYGSDALGGVINLRSLSVPYSNGMVGSVQLLAESNNNLLGTTFGLQARKDRWFYRARFTLNDYGDFKVPADKIIYENYVFDLSDKHLRNAAGTEKDMSFSFGYADSSFKTETFLSNYNAKNGFFANAHGLEVRTSSIDYDHSDRDVDYPYHTVNHFKMISNSTLIFDHHELRLNVGFQNNVREEHTEPVAHGYMPKPVGTLDRRYVKNTLTADLQDEMKFSSKHSIVFGVNAEYQNNGIDGWGFLIPSYDRFTAGVYAYDKLEIDDNVFLHSGLRYDLGTISTDSYYDWYPSLLGSDMKYLKRASDNRSKFDHISAVAGLSYIRNKTNYKINIGKSFRIPLASEFSSNGVNYHMFRYEKGNQDLRAETSYQLDAEASYENGKVGLSLTPFINYFDNYIYLNPTANYFETLQVYEYTQNKVFRAGGEISAEYRPFTKLGMEATAEYVYSRQMNGLKKGFTLPFSPPFRALFSVNYLFNNIWFLQDLRLKTDLRLSAIQNNIVPPERTTDSYGVLDVALTAVIRAFKEQHPTIRLKINNLFNQKYFDHLSFYRLIEVPQPGRNASISLTIPF